MLLKTAIIGGGAAGYFAAIRYKSLHPGHKTVIFEKTGKVLGKVKISGGGRCNVTHACFVIKDLIGYYPRGARELIGPFHRFQPADTIKWFEDRGVTLKTEPDGRVFPVSDQSQTIIDCLIGEAQRLGIELLTSQDLESIELGENGGFQLQFAGKPEHVFVDRLIVTTGSSEKVWKILETMGHRILPPVPSLFTFNIRDERLLDFQGLSWPDVEVRDLDFGHRATGPLLITHWGLSGPAVLKLSAIGALDFHKARYRFEIGVNFMFPDKADAVAAVFQKLKRNHPNKLVSQSPPGPFTARLWQSWSSLWGFSHKTWQEVSMKEIGFMARQITEAKFKVEGKSTFKEEFVTCGGVDLKEVDLKTMESKKIPGLYFAGEVLNIDALTGGFNFQAAWTTGWLAGSHG